MESKQGDRIIVLVDMDCFYVQVEQKLCPEFLNKPCAVVQYNTWKGGGIIAVNYEARAQGVKRGTRGEEAQKLCPDIHLFRVPEVRGKADLTRYREAGASVLNVLCEFSDCVERASIDEAYIDLTSVINSRLHSEGPVNVSQMCNTYVSGWEDPNNEIESVSKWLKMIYQDENFVKDQMLALAAVIVEEIRAAVLSKTGYKCSAGIAHNKMLAKLSCGLHKPNKQTLLPEASIPMLYDTILINKVRNLGGKFGVNVCEKFGAKTMGDLLKISKVDFLKAFGEKSGSWLYNLSRGIEHESVTPRSLPKSIGCGKNFPGKSALDTKEKVLHWVNQLAIELEERLLKDQETNQRIARLLTLNIRNQTTAGFSVASKSCPIHLYKAEKIAHDAFLALQKFNSALSTSNVWNPAIVSLAMAVSKFEDGVDSMCDIQSYFQTIKSPIDFCETSSIGSSSAIDTVLNLLENEKGLKTDNEPYGKSSILDDQPKKKQLKVMSDYFSVKQEIDICSRSNDTPTESICTLHSITEDLTDSGKSILLKKPITKSLTSCDENIKKNYLIKGFFAKKFEERMKLKRELQVIDTDSDRNKFAESLMPNSIVDEKILQRKNTFELSNSEHISHVNLSAPSNSFYNKSINNDQVASMSELSNKMETVNSLSSCDNSELDPELLKVCSYCNMNVPIWEEEEHNDYHVALSLSKEFQSERNSVPKVTSAQNSELKLPIKNSKVSRRKRGISRMTTKLKKNTQTNTLDVFIKGT